jgi:hypothetical protein
MWKSKPLVSWRWRQHVTPKSRRTSTKLHDVTSYKTSLHSHCHEKFKPESASFRRVPRHKDLWRIGIKAPYILKFLPILGGRTPSRFERFALGEGERETCLHTLDRKLRGPRSWSVPGGQQLKSSCQESEPVVPDFRELRYWPSCPASEMHRRASAGRIRGHIGRERHRDCGAESVCFVFILWFIEGHRR